MEQHESSPKSQERRKSGILKKNTQDMDAESPKQHPHHHHHAEHVKFDE